MFNHYCSRWVWLHGKPGNEKGPWHHNRILPFMWHYKPRLLRAVNNSNRRWVTWRYLFPVMIHLYLSCIMLQHAASSMERLYLRLFICIVSIECMCNKTNAVYYQWAWTTPSIGIFVQYKLRNAPFWTFFIRSVYTRVLALRIAWL